MIAWIYLVSTLVLFIIGATFQIKKYLKKDEKKDNNNLQAKLSNDYHGYN